MSRDTEHESRTLTAIRNAVTKVPFYAKQSLASKIEGATTLDETLARLPLLTRDRVRPTLPKQWFPEGRDAKAELAAGNVNVIEVGPTGNRVRVMFEPRWWKMQEHRALSLNPHAAGTWREAVLWVPERGTGSCGAGDPEYEDRLEGTRLHVNSRQDPTFWTEPVMTRMLDELTVHDTTALLADPFYLDVLARHAAVLGRRLDVKGFLSFMRARPTLAHRAAIARVFQGNSVDVLSAREVGTLFVQDGPGGSMQHAPLATHVELLPARVPTPGAENLAAVVVTTIEREIQPLVRYVLGDLVQVAPGAGKYTTVSPIASVEGTLDDSIVRPDGALITPGALDRAIGPGPRGYQVIQLAPDTIEVEVIGAAPAEVEGAVASLCAGMKVSARAVTAIGVEPNGKYRTTRRSNVPLAIEAAFSAVGSSAVRHEGASS